MSSKTRPGKWKAYLMGHWSSGMDPLYPPEQLKPKSPGLTCSRERPPQPSTYLQPSAAPLPGMLPITLTCGGSLSFLGWAVR